MNIYRSTCFIFSLFVLGSLSAQGFFKSYGPVSSIARDVVQTADGGYFLAGHVGADSTLFLQRVDAVGQAVWANHLNLNHAKAIAVTKTNDGGFAVLTEFYVDTNGYKNAVLKINASGAPEWTKIVDNYALPNGLRDLVATTDGGLLLAGDTRDPGLQMKNWVVKLGADGNIAWQKTYGTAFLGTNNIVALPDGSFVVSGGRNTDDLSLCKLNAAGDLVWQQTYLKPEAQRAYELIATNDGGLAVLGTTQKPLTGALDYCILKADTDGNLLWFNDFPANNNLPVEVLPVLGSFTQDDAGNYYVPYSTFGVQTSIVFAKISPSGALLWSQELFTEGYAWKTLHTQDNFIALAGESNNQAFLMKLDLDGNYLSNLISGKVFADDDEDCSSDSGEAGLEYFIIKATDQSNTSFYKRTAPDGTFEIHVPEGTFSLTAKPYVGLADFYTSCLLPDISITGTNQVVSDQFIGIQSVAECPLLDISVAEGILRRCQPTPYSIYVYNYGNLTAEQVSVQVTADNALSYVSSNVPLSSQNGQVFTFDLPDLAPGANLQFNVNFQVSCNTQVGDVICVTAHAFPDTTCIPPSSSWDGSEVEVTGECDNGNISFKIKNTGTAPMSNALDYVIIEDHIMFMQGAVQLAANEDTTIVIENPSGQCYLGKVDDNANQSSQIDLPAAVVANCVNGGNLSLAMQFETEPNNLAIANTCGQIVGSFDPNDKQGFPLGWNDYHLIERNQDIEYLVRFQNTGNDTAFLVVIRDTLDVATLDPGSLRPVAASHPYTWNLSGTGIVTFRFDNILLPDSNTNEPASHGFVRFRLRQKPDLVDGSLIKNDAAIYFDFNDPIITNEYFHTVGSPHVVATKNPEATQLLDFKVLPNPFSAEATFVIQGYLPKGEVRFTLIDPIGKVVREERFLGNTYPFKSINLSPGIYYFKMEEGGALLTAGRVVISK